MDAKKDKHLYAHKGHHMLQKIFLTCLLVQSTGIIMATNVPIAQTREYRAPWRYVPLSTTSVVLASQIIATSPFVPFPISCVALAGCAAVILAPDDVKNACLYSGKQVVAGYKYAEKAANQKIGLTLTILEKHLEKKNTAYIKPSGW